MHVWIECMIVLHVFSLSPSTGKRKKWLDVVAVQLLVPFLSLCERILFFFGTIAMQLSTNIYLCFYLQCLFFSAYGLEKEIKKQKNMKQRRQKSWFTDSEKKTSEKKKKVNEAGLEKKVNQKVYNKAYS